MCLCEHDNVNVPNRSVTQDALRAVTKASSELFCCVEMAPVFSVCGFELGSQRSKAEGDQDRDAQFQEITGERVSSLSV